MYIVCKEGNIENVECLLEIRVDVNLSDENGFIFFYIVCKCGYIYILWILFDIINNVIG